MKYPLIDCLSWQHFCRLIDVINIPDRNTIWHFGQHIGKARAQTLFEDII
ncbi:transposase [Photorhabdus bodei]